MRIELIENESINEFYTNSDIFDELANITRKSWIKNKLFPADYTLERTKNHLLTMEKRFPHLVIILLYSDNKLAGWIGISKSDEGQLEIDRWNPVIHPEISEESTSQLLIKESLQYAKKNNFKDISVSFAINNEDDQVTFNSFLTYYSYFDFKKRDEMWFMALVLSENQLFIDIKERNFNKILLLDVDPIKIAECLYKSFKHSEDRFFLENLSKEEVLSEFKRRIDPESIVNTSSIVLSDNENIIGFALVKDRGFDTHLDLLCVDPAYRNMGYSKIIMKNIIDSLINQKIIILTIGLDPVNSTALSLYQKIGFKKRSSIIELSLLNNSIHD